MKDKVAYITGGTKGIGFGVAKLLVDNGMRVAISGRKLEDAQATAKKLSSDESRVLGLSSDVSSLENEENAVKEVLAKFWSVRCCVGKCWRRALCSRR